MRDLDYRLFTSPIDELHAFIEPDSVNWIITDPPYPKEYLDTFSILSHFASKALRTDGGLIVMSGQYFLPEVMNRLQEHLDYHWCCCYLTPGGQAAYNHPRKVNPFWKPILIMKRRDANWSRSFGDVIKTSPNNNDKSHHHWGQNVQGFDDLIVRFTLDNDLVLDPFVGGGTTAIAALKNQRRFIGADHDEKCIEMTKKRVDAFIKDSEKLECQFGLNL